MADYTVEGIQSAKLMQVDNEMQFHEAAKSKKDAQKLAAKAAEVNVKKMAQDKAKIEKMAEQRLSRILMMKIERRFEAFPFLKDRIPAISPRASLPELQETDEMQKLELDLQGSEDRVMAYLSQGSMALEGIWGDGRSMTFLPASLRLNLTGFGRIVNSPLVMNDIKPLVKETVIEYPTIGQMSLPMRWFQTIFSSMLLVHQINSDPKMKKMMGLAEQPEQPAQTDKPGMINPPTTTTTTTTQSDAQFEIAQDVYKKSKN